MKERPRPSLSVPHVNGMTVTQANDPFKMTRPASITATVGAATPWASGTYAYDGAGNIKAIGSNFYYYDLVSRVVDGTAEYTNGSVHKRQTYGYDPYGNMNRITTVVNGAQTENFLMSPSTATNRLTTSATYDESGNQTGWGSWLYAFDGLNMMQSNNNGSRTLRYVYTADDERIAIHDGTTVKWRLRGVDNKVLREYRLLGGTWSWQKDYVYRGSSLLATDEPSIGIRHFALDHLGTPRLITSSTSATVSLHNYYPFGQEATSETQDAEVMKFTGHERDTELTNAMSSIDYMHARYYSVRLGRFLSVDPGKDWDPTQPQSWSMYQYTRGNPVNAFDPDGKRVQYTKAFIHRLKSDDKFADAFRTWRSSKSGRHQHRSMLRDQNTDYKFDVGNATVHDSLGRREVRGLTNPPIPPVNDAGKGDAPQVHVLINADFISNMYSTSPAGRTPVKEMAVTLFHESEHALDLGAGIASPSEGRAREHPLTFETDEKILQYKKEIDYETDKGTHRDN